MSIKIVNYIFTYLMDFFFFYRTDPYFGKTKEALRILCTKLSMIEAFLKPLPKNSLFSINIVSNRVGLTSLTENNKFNNFPWIINNNIKKIECGVVIPINNFDLDFLCLQCILKKRL